MANASQTTKQRILEAAGDIFGKEGFKAATIRRIARKAKVNIAAINYHFGGKKGLYTAVLDHVFKIGFTSFPADMGIGPDRPPEERLLNFIRGMFYRLLSPDGWGGHDGHGRLLAWELLEPTPAFDHIAEQYIAPHRDRLLSIVTAILGHNQVPEKLRSCVVSIISQCVYYSLAAPMIERLTDLKGTSSAALDKRAEFVWRFSLGGIAAIGATNQADGALPYEISSNQGSMTP